MKPGDHIKIDTSQYFGWFVKSITIDLFDKDSTNTHEKNKVCTMNGVQTGIVLDVNQNGRDVMILLDSGKSGWCRRAQLSLV